MTQKKTHSGTSSVRTGKKRSSPAAKRRKKEKERLHRLAVLLAAAVIAVGIGLMIRAVTRSLGPGQYDSSTAEFRKNGGIRVTSVESFDEDYYDADELKNMIQEAVSSYNQEKGGSGVSRKYFRVADKTAVVVLDYQSAEDYQDFNGTPLFMGTVGDAQSEGYDFESIMAAVSHEDSSRILNQATLDQLAGNEVIILTEQVNVVMPRGILYATPNLGVTDELHATAIDTISAEKPAIVILK